MLLNLAQCSIQATSHCISCLILSLNVLALPATHGPTRKPNKNAQETFWKERSTRKPRVAPHQKPKAQQQRAEGPDPEEYYDDASEMVDEYAAFFPEGPYGKVDHWEQLIKHNVVPDFISFTPHHLLEIYYRNATVLYGNMLSYKETKVEPSLIKWHYEPHKHYTLIMTDPDGPFGDAHSHEEEWHHWLVTNILGHHIGIGDVYSEYIGVTQSRGKHIHRYVFLIYEQPGNDTIDFDEIHLGPEPIDMLRGYFSTKKFVKKYNLTGPVACNFFFSDWSKAPRMKLTTEIPYSTFDPEDFPDQKCHMCENIDDIHPRHPQKNGDISDIFPDIRDIRN